jgi:hypothetical protein
MDENDSLAVLPLMNVAELKQGRFYLRARTRYLEIAEGETVGYMLGMMIVVVLMMVCSRWVLEEGDRHKYPGHAKVAVEALASLTAGDYSIAAVAEPAVAVDAAALDAALDAAAVAAAAAVGPAAVAEAQELEDSVAGRHCHQTWMWETEED